MSEEFKSFEASGWAARADSYDELMGVVTARFVEPLLDAAGVQAGMRLLDVACGPGTLAAQAAARGAEPVGIDLADGMLALARERHPELRFVRGDVEQLPFDDASFDAVTAGFLLHHAPAPARAAAQLARVLTPGGRLAATVWERPERMRLLGLVNDAMVHAGADPAAGLPDGPRAFGFAEPAGLTALLTGAGFEAVDVHPIRFAHRAATADELWDGLRGGTVRTAEQLDGLPASVRERVRAAFTELAEAHRGADGVLEIPVAALLASGRRRYSGSTRGCSSVG